MLKLGETEFGNGHTQRDYNPISVRPRSLSVRPTSLGFVAVAKTIELGPTNSFYPAPSSSDVIATATNPRHIGLTDRDLGLTEMGL